jgi:predicted nucleic acid-binding Zn ribbon protein
VGYKNLIKTRLISKRGRKCESCNLSEWKQQPIPLEVHHILPNNEHESNLQLLCPNCHSLTPNYRGRGIQTVRTKTDKEITDAVSKAKSLRGVLIILNLVAKGGNYEVLRKRLLKLDLLDKFRIVKPTKLCLYCAVEIDGKKKFCSSRCAASFHQNSCRSKRRTKIQWPPYEVVKKMTEEHSFLWAERQLGVTDNAIRKFLRKHEMAP